MTPLLRKANDDKAFERLYQRHVKDVFRYSLAVLGETADAEDVTQTTFLNAYRAFQRGERPEKPENWLIAIAHNVCRQRFRQQQRRPSEVEFEDELGGAVERDEDGPTLDELRRAFAALPPNQRAALVMRELEGRTYNEIAEVLGLTVSALETLLFRARRALREQLEDQLSCREAAFALSKQLDGRLSAGERRVLRAHLRGCPECSRLAHSQRAQRKALRGLLAVPLPQSLQTFLPHAGEAAAAGSAAAAGGTAIAIKAAAVVAAGTLVGGGAYEGATRVPPLLRHDVAATHAAVHKQAAPRPVALAVAPAPAAHAPAVPHPQARPPQAVAAPRSRAAAQPPSAAVGHANATPVHERPAAAPATKQRLLHARPAQKQKQKKQKQKQKQAHPAQSRAPLVPKPHDPKPQHTQPAPAHGSGNANGKVNGGENGSGGETGGTAGALPVTVPVVPDVLPPLTTTTDVESTLPTTGHGKPKLPKQPTPPTLP